MKEFDTTDIDLRSFPYVMFEVALRDSPLATTATAEEFRAAILLRCAAWHQVPAGTLPNDEKFLTHAAGLGRDVEAFRRIKEGALQEFTIGTDGRLHHEVLKQRACDLEAKRQLAKRRTASATAALKHVREHGKDGRKADHHAGRSSHRDADRNDGRDADRNDHQQKGTKLNKKDNSGGSHVRKVNSRESQLCSTGAGAVHVKCDTPEWRAWNAHRRRNGQPTLPQDKNFGWYCDSQWPPGQPNYCQPTSQSDPGGIAENLRSTP